MRPSLFFPRLHALGALKAPAPGSAKLKEKHIYLFNIHLINIQSRTTKMARFLLID
jgi:hypothetical protein